MASEAKDGYWITLKYCISLANAMSIWLSTLKGSNVSSRIMMLNFLRIRDGDRFWYERYLSKEVSGIIMFYHYRYGRD